MLTLTAYFILCQTTSLSRPTPVDGFLQNQTSKNIAAIESRKTRHKHCKSWINRWYWLLSIFIPKFGIQKKIIQSQAFPIHVHSILIQFTAQTVLGIFSNAFSHGQLSNRQFPKWIFPKWKFPKSEISQSLGYAFCNLQWGPSAAARTG